MYVMWDKRNDRNEGKYQGDSNSARSVGILTVFNEFENFMKFQKAPKFHKISESSTK